MDFTKEQLSEVLCKHAKRENGLQDLMEIMIESMMVAERREYLHEDGLLGDKGNGFRMVLRSRTQETMGGAGVSEANGVPTKVGCQAARSRHFMLYPHLSILHKVLHCIQDFLRTGNSQYLELQISERNGIEGIVLEGDDDRAVVIRRWWP